jgi:hypothetical protein
VIHVEQRALRALEQNRRPASHRAMHHQPHVIGERQQSLGEPSDQRDDLVGVDASLAAEVLELSVRMLGAPLDEVAQSRRMSQVEHAHAAARDLVFVRWSDSTTRGADRRARRALAIDELVVRQH